MVSKPKLLKEWTKRLSLSNWRIDAKFDCTPDEMFLDDVEGSANFQYTNREARIRILGPVYAPKTSEIYAYDEEKILVHELLHVKFAAICDNGETLHDKITHQIIDDLAWALVNAKRKTTNGGNNL